MGRWTDSGANSKGGREKIDGKTCLVTGSTSGIGKEIAKGLAGMGASVVLVGRDKTKCEAVANEIAQQTGSKNPIAYLVADLASQSSIRAMVQEFIDRFQQLDVLVNNAGVFRARREITPDGIEYTFAVNHIAPFLTTNLLADRLKAADKARVVTTSSIAHRGAGIDFGDIQFTRKRYSGIRAYAQSKLANILFTKELARRLEGSGVTANCFHPGGVRTNLSQGNPWYYKLVWSAATPFFTTAENGADTGIYLATSVELDGVTGKYYVKRKESDSSCAAKDADSAAKLWDLSKELTGTS
jgi:NAD(P)-dependent dehydrogenase (short-subunit alcohol dehydrogenase family)